jgi:hypothetical protein
MCEVVKERFKIIILIDRISFIYHNKRLKIDHVCKSY